MEYSIFDYSILVWYTSDIRQEKLKLNPKSASPMIQETDSVPLLSGWRVSKIEVVNQGRAVEVEFTIDGRSPFRFRTRKFGIGGRNARTAALSRFAARAGYGNVSKVFAYLKQLPRNGEGRLFAIGSSGSDPDAASPLFSPTFRPKKVAS